MLLLRRRCGNNHFSSCHPRIKHNIQPMDTNRLQRPYHSWLHQIYQLIQQCIDDNLPNMSQWALLLSNRHLPSKHHTNPTQHQQIVHWRTPKTHNKGKTGRIRTMAPSIRLSLRKPTQHPSIASHRPPTKIRMASIPIHRLQRTSLHTETTRQQIRRTPPTMWQRILHGLRFHALFNIRLQENQQADRPGGPLIRRIQRLPHHN